MHAYVTLIAKRDIEAAATDCNGYYMGNSWVVMAMRPMLYIFLTWRIIKDAGMVPSPWNCWKRRDDRDASSCVYKYSQWLPGILLEPKPVLSLTEGEVSGSRVRGGRPSEPWCSRPMSWVHSLLPSSSSRPAFRCSCASECSETAPARWTCPSSRN